MLDTRCLRRVPYPRVHLSRTAAKAHSAERRPSLTAMPSLDEQAQIIAEMYQRPPAQGRPSLIADKSRLQELFAAVEAGNYLQTACDLAEISHTTLNNWRQRGEQGEIPYASFVAALKRAMARAEVRAVANIRKAGELPQFWASEMTYLERRYPERWGRRQEDTATPRVVVQIGAGAGEVKVGIATFAPLG